MLSSHLTFFLLYNNPQNYCKGLIHEMKAAIISRQSGRMSPESLAECHRNRWPNVAGIGGRMSPESVAGCDRIPQNPPETELFDPKPGGKQLLYAKK
jgi:hypothetical protein